MLTESGEAEGVSIFNTLVFHIPSEQNSSLVSASMSKDVALAKQMLLLTHWLLEAQQPSSAVLFVHTPLLHVFVILFSLLSSPQHVVVETLPPILQYLLHPSQRV